MLENGVRIPSLDGKDIFVSNNCVNQKINENGKPIGYRLRNQAGVLNLGRFINTLDYSLDLIKMQEVFAQICPSEQFSFYQNKKDYTYRVINVTFKYSNKQYNKVQKGDKTFYILHKYMKIERKMKNRHSAYDFKNKRPIVIPEQECIEIRPGTALTDCYDRMGGQ